MKGKKLFSGLLLLLALGLLCTGRGQASYLTERWTSFAYAFYQLDVVTGPPAIGDDGSIYASTEQDCVFALHPDGKLKWCSFPQDGNYVQGSPAIAPNGAVIIHTGVTVYALDPLDGGSMGEVKCVQGAPFDGAPAVSKAGIVYVGSQSNTAGGGTPPGAKLYACDVYQETRLWEYTVPFPATGGSMAVARFSNPVIGSDGTIYCLYESGVVGGQSQHGLYAINPDGTLKASREFDIGGPAAPWTLFSPAIGPDGTIYVISMDHLFALSPADLSSKWEKHITGRPTGSPIIGLPVAPWETYSIFIPWGFQLKCIGGKLGEDYGTFQADPGFETSTPAIDKSGYVYFGTYTISTPDQGQLGLLVFGQYETILIDQIPRSSGIHSSPAIVKVGDRSVAYICEKHSISAWNNNINGVEPGLALTSWPCDRGNLKRNGRVRSTFLAWHALAELMVSVQHYQFPQGITASLTAKLASASQALAKEEIKPSINKINAFINEVMALKGKQIPAREATAFIASAQGIVSELR
jgi:outer membrane protein assembly factor BamB